MRLTDEDRQKVREHIADLIRAEKSLKSTNFLIEDASIVLIHTHASEIIAVIANAMEDIRNQDAS